MKKIYILLVAVGMTALATQANAQCGKIQSIQGPSQDPCENENADFMIVPGPSSQNGTFTWSRMSGNPLPASFISNVDGNATLYQASKNDEDTYICTFVGSNCTEVAVVDLVVKSNPNAGFAINTQCNLVTLTPGGGDYYLTYDQNGGLTVPFTGYSLSGTGLLLTGGGFRAFKDGCYSDVTINQIWANPMSITAIPTKWKINPGQTSTINATSNYPIKSSATKWFKNGVQIVSSNGANSLTVSDTGTYKVQMRADVASGSCVKAKQIKIKPKTVASINAGEKLVDEGSTNTLDLRFGPNPASTQIQIFGYDEFVRIFDANGRLIVEYKLNIFNGNEVGQTMDISSLPNGLYLIRSGDQSQKLVVSR